MLALGLMLFRGAPAGCASRSNQPASSVPNDIEATLKGPAATLNFFLSPKLPLCRYQERASRQLTGLGGYSDDTVIEAEIPAMKANG
jgi:hypothetical protein